jgi:hypothetical protein
MITRPELTGVPGVPETALSDELLARLPDNLAPAPWDVRCTGLVWTGRGGRAARAAFAPALRDSSARASVGGFVRYSETPVGPYDEVFGLVASADGRKSWGTVSFMAVDSEASLVGGRTNWSMPKTLAQFDGDFGRKQTIRGWSDGPVRWRLEATAVAVGPRLKVRSRQPTRQEFPDGVVRDSAMVAAATIRPALVRVRVESDGPLASWLRPGLHAGALIESAEFTLDAPAEPS